MTIEEMARFVNVSRIFVLADLYCFLFDAKLPRGRSKDQRGKIPFGFYCPRKIPRMEYVRAVGFERVFWRIYTSARARAIFYDAKLAKSL